MLTVWLVRHGEAVDPDQAPSDFDRVLTEAGRRRIETSVRWLLEREASPEIILHSPLVRARQTAEAIRSEIGLDQSKILVETRLAPGVNLPELLRHVGALSAECIVCVGHQPDMGRCLAGMIGGADVVYSPGTIAGIQFSGAVSGNCGRLRWFVDPAWFA